MRSEEATLAAVRDELSVRPREAAKFPVDFFERSTLVTPASDILFSGDALQTTNQGVIKQRLSATSDEYVSATSKASLTLSVNNQNSEQLVVGVRVLLGAAHAQHIPATVSVFGRAIATQEGRRRWYDVPLTAAEAVLGHKTLPITFGATHTGAHIPVVDSIEVYAQSKSDFGWDAQLAALAAKHSASSGADGDGGHAIKEAAPPPPHATMLRSLVSSLRQLVGFHGAAAAAPPPPHLRDEMVGALPSVFTLGPPFSALRGPCKLLLRQLEPDAARYHALKDHAQLSHALRALTDADGNGGDGGGSDKSAALKPTMLSQLVHTTLRLARKRPHNLHAFLTQSDGGRLLSALCAKFDELHDAVGGRFPQLAQFVRSLVHLLCAVAQQAVAAAGGAAAPPAAQLDASGLRSTFGLLHALLVSKSEAVRSTTSLTLSRLLLNRAPSDADDSPPAPPPAPAAGGGGGGPAAARRRPGGGPRAGSAVARLRESAAASAAARRSRYAGAIEAFGAALSPSSLPSSTEISRRPTTSGADGGGR